MHLTALYGNYLVTYDILNTVYLKKPEELQYLKSIIPDDILNLKAKCL